MADVLKKVPVREQEPAVRAKNFDEVCYGYNKEEAMEEATRCLGCKNAKCVEGCPVSIDIPGFIKEVKEGKKMWDFLLSLGEKAIDKLISLRVKPTVVIEDFRIESGDEENKIIHFFALISNNGDKALSLSKKHLAFIQYLSDFYASPHSENF